MNKYGTFCFPLALLMVFLANAVAGELSLDQKLIVACHRLDVSGVVTALRSGADVDSTFGADGTVRFQDTLVFQDKWTTGIHMAAKNWTPLIALANASKYPDPAHKIENTPENLERLPDLLKKVPKSLIERRQRDRLTILAVLLSHTCNIDADDGCGATALYCAISRKQTEMAKSLVEHGAEVNTTTGIYIDGVGGKTPLHAAFWSPELTKLLLEKGADPNAKDGAGRTAADYVKSQPKARGYNYDLERLRELTGSESDDRTQPPD